MQNVASPSQLLLVENPADGVEPGAADFRRHIRREKPGIDSLRAQLSAQRLVQLAGGLNLLLVRIQLGLDELAGCFDDQLLLFGQREVHEDTFLEGAATVSCAQACKSCSCRRSCSTCLAAG